MKLISLSVIATYAAVVSAVPGGRFNSLEKRGTTTETISNLRLVHVVEEKSFTTTSTTTVTDVNTKTQTDYSTEYLHHLTSSRSLLDPWPLIASASKPVPSLSVSHPSITITPKASSTFPWPAVDFTDSSRGHGSSPPWPVVTDITKSANEDFSVSWPSGDYTDVTRSRGNGSPWPGVEITHITRSRAYSTDVEYIDITRSRGVNPEPVATMYEALNDDSEYEQIW
ncbi:uncharacterized protein EV154DRAFT_482838 [Mucor mucedo]|uniref:uncharacterized protein n=1 Tax=Mucor mucedo TaxID=29922 RepID=UPI002220B2D6|nr:uncharacterized protein EV154DRAFT_482838 [Mucor mucedo]KAI7889825.1 hypothetical protein EV154DRAFT_482838 [Mucor mucedo]